LVAIGRRSRPAAFSIAWVFAALLPVSQIVPIGAFIAERFLYLPSVGAALVLGLAADRLFRSASDRRVAVLAVAPFALGLLPILRTRDWSDEEKFWTAAIASNPHSYKSRVNLGNHYEDRRCYAAAEAAFREAASLDPKPVEALSNLGRVLQEAGKD